MTRRSNHEGGKPRQRADGRWTAQVSWTDEDGQPQRRSVYGKTRREVEERRDEMRRRLAKGQPPVDARQQLADFTRCWITSSLLASDRKATTKTTYSSIARNQIADSGLGRLPLDKVTPRQIERWLVELREEQECAQSTVRQAFTVLGMILGTAVRDKLLADNPAEKISRPKVDHHEARCLDRDEVDRLLAEATGSRYLPVYRFLAKTGLRRGEALALRWDDVDLDEQILHVRSTLVRIGGRLQLTPPKSARSRRDISLGAGAVEILREVRVRQAEERLAAGPSQWHEHGFVFATEFGLPTEPRNVARQLEACAARAGLAGVTLHTLRHSAASAMLTSGVDLITVSRHLGHQSIAVTSDLYGHIKPSVSRAAANVLDEALG